MGVALFKPKQLEFKPTVVVWGLDGRYVRRVGGVEARSMVDSGIARVDGGGGRRVHQVRLLASASTMCSPDPNRSSRSSLSTTFRERVCGEGGKTVGVVIQHKRILAEDRWAYCLAVANNRVEESV